MQAGRDAEKDLVMCEAATPGPWVVDGENAVILDGNGQIVVVLDANGEPDNDDFIAEAREALPYWIKRALAAEAEAERLQTENLRLVMLPSSRYEMLVEVLQWYADENAYNIPHIGCTSKVMTDRGKRARDTLQEIGFRT